MSLVLQHKKPEGQAVATDSSTLAQRIEIINWHKANAIKQQDTVDHFKEKLPKLKLDQSLLSKWLKKEDLWRKQWIDNINAGAYRSHIKRIRRVNHPQIEKMLELWVSKAMQDRITLSGEVLRQKWVDFANIAGVPVDKRIRLSNGWLSAEFKRRHGLRQIKRHGEAGSVSEESVKQERERMKSITQRYQRKDIFNMDETSLFYHLPLDRGLANTQFSGIRNKKIRLTYAFTSNADGSEKHPPFVIGYSRKPRVFGNKTGTEHGFYYRHSNNAWMNSELYQEWLSSWDRQLASKNRYILLLQDNFSGHISPNGLTHIRVENFKPNMTSHIQPMDQGIIHCFKANYRAHYIRRVINQYDKKVTAGKIYDINQLEAMHLANSAWDDVTPQTIRNCWQKAGILHAEYLGKGSLNTTPTIFIPISSLVHPSPQDATTNDNPIAHAEGQVEEALDQLVSRRVLHPSNRMSFQMLQDEEWIRDKDDQTITEEIYAVVQQLIQEEPEERTV